MNFDFQRIDRAFRRGTVMPDGVARLTKTTLVLSADIARKLRSAAYKTTTGLEGIHVGILYDARNQAFKFYPDPENGFAFFRNGDDADAPYRTTGLPAALNRAAPVTGDYVEVPGEVLVYQLQR